MFLDPNLVNPWGLASSTPSPTASPIWVSDNGTGVATLYNGAGVAQSLVPTIPPPNGSPPGTFSAPTGVVFNPTAGFGGSRFIFATEDGTIASWKLANGTTAVLQVDNSGSFTDPNLPAGYAPFGINNIGGKIYVTYAQQDGTKHDDVAGAGHGFIDVYDTNGHLLNRLVSQGVLNSPWGLALAPSNFGVFSNDLLVGNFGDGTINAFDITTG
jgi:hypothetical protein